MAIATVSLRAVCRVYDYVDDRAPGGDLNPDGTKTLQWMAKLLGAVRWLGVATMLLVSVVLADTLSEKAAIPRLAPAFVALVVLPLLLALCFFDGRRFRWAAWLAGGLSAIAIILATAT